MANNYELQITAGLNIPKSIALINSSIQKIEGQLKKLKLQAQLDKGKSNAELQRQISELNKQKRQLFVDLKLRQKDLKKQYLQAVSQVQTKPINMQISTTNAQKQMTGLTNTVQTARSETVTLAHSLQKALSNTGLVVSSQTALLLVRKAAREATEAVKEYNKYITNLSIITGGSKESSNDILADLSEKSFEFKVDIAELETAYETLLRTGKAASELDDYLKSTVYLSKTGFEDMDTSAENLVTIGNSFKVPAEEIENVVSKLVALDTASNTVAGKLSTAMAKAGANARLAGLSIDELGAIIAGLRDTTGKTEDSIATSLNSITSRLYNVKLGKYEIELEDGTTEDITESLNNTERMLKTVGIEIRSSKGEFKDIQVIIDELVSKWEMLNDVQRNSVAFTFAGTHHKNTFINLIENWKRINELKQISADSAGQAESKFNSYLESIESKSATLSTAMKDFWNNALPNEYLGNIIDATTGLVKFTDEYRVLQTMLKSVAFYGLAKGIVALKNGFIGVVADVKNVSYAMNLATQSSAMTQAQFRSFSAVLGVLSDKQLKLVLSNSKLTESEMIKALAVNGTTEAEARQKLSTLGIIQANKNAATSTFSLTGAFKSLWAVIKANPIGALTLAFTSLVMIYDSAKRKQEELREEIKETAKTSSEEIENIKELYNTYLDISEAVSNGTKTKEDLQTATNNLIETLKDEGIEVDELVKKYGNLSEVINKAMIDSIKEKLPDLSAGVTANADTLIEEGNKTVDGMSHGFALSDKDADFYDFVTEFIKEYEKINGDDVFTSTFEGFDTYRLFVGSNQAGKVGTVTEYKQQLDALTALRQSLFEEYGADVEDNAFYNSITERINALKPLYEEYEKSLAEYNAYNAAIVVGESKLADEPDNFKEYIKYKNELIEKVLNDENNSGFRGSDEDIKNSISEYLLSDSDLSAFENRLNMLSEAKKQFIAYEGSQKFNFLSDLSDENLEIALKIPDLFEDGLDGATQKILEWKANPDNVITPEVDTKTFSDMADEVSSKTKLMSTAMEEMRDIGHISASTYSEIVEMGGNFAECLEIQNGQLVLNVQKLKELETQEYKNKISENNLTIAMLQREAATRAMSNGDWQSISKMITDLQKENEFNQLLIDEINNAKPDNKGKEDTTDYNKANFEAEKAKRKHWLEMGKDDQGKKYTEDMYYAWLDSAEGYKHYFSDLTKYQYEYWQYEEECYDYIVSSAEKNANAELDVLKDKFDKGIILTDEYVAGVNAIYDKYKDKNGNSLLSDDFLGDSLDPEKLYDSRLEEWKKANNYDENDLDSRKNFAEYRKSLATEMFGDEKSDSHNPKKLAEEIKESDEEIENVWKDRVEREKTYWESLQTQIEDYYDNEIKKLQEIADEEKRINKQEELRNNLIKARQELENAKKNKNQLVFVDGMFKYVEDQEAVLSASEKVDDAEQAIVDNNRETEIALLEEQKNNATEFYKNILKKFDDYINHLDGKDIPTASDTEVMGAVSDYAGNTPKKLYTISEAADILCERYGIDKNSDVWKNFATNVISNNPPILPMPSIQNNNIYNNNYNTPVSVNGVNVRVNGGLSQKEVEDIVSDGIETFAREVSARLTCLSYKVR